MTMMTFRSRSTRLAGTVAGFCLLLTAGACDDKDGDGGILTPSTARVYTQIERLGNPLVSEVFFPKRDHGLHNNKGPIDDPKTMANGGTDVPGHIKTFV